MASKCEKFLDYFDSLIKTVGQTKEEMPEDVIDFYNTLRASQKSYSDKPTFTEMGLSILEFMKANTEMKSVKAREIADGMALPSRKVSGAMQKLVTDGYVDKFGQNPVMYTLSDKGKNFNLNEYKENMNNEEEND